MRLWNKLSRKLRFDLAALWREWARSISAPIMNVVFLFGSLLHRIAWSFTIGVIFVCIFLACWNAWAKPNPFHELHVPSSYEPVQARVGSRWWAYGLVGLAALALMAIMHLLTILGSEKSSAGTSMALTVRQALALKEAVSPMHSTRVVVIVDSAYDTAVENYASQFMAIFRDAGLSVDKLQYQLTFKRLPPLFVKCTARLSDEPAARRALARDAHMLDVALLAAGLTPKLQTTSPCLTATNDSGHVELIVSSPQ
jgi:hypothetical protein